MQRKPSWLQFSRHLSVVLQGGVVVLRQHQIFGCVVVGTPARLATEAVQGPALPLQGIHHIKSGDSLAPGVLSVGDCVPDDVLQEHLQEQGASTQRNCC